MQGKLEERIRSLERKLATVTTERDDLQKDVEALCLQNGSSVFSRSYVLSERVSATDVELKEARAKIASLSRVQEDMCAVQIGKSAAEHLAAKQQMKLDDMEKELKHFQVQLSQMVGERDQALFESEDSRRKVSQFEQEAREAKKQVEELEELGRTLQQQLGAALGTQQRQQQELEARQEEWEEAGKQLHVLTEERKKSDGAIAALQAKLVLHQSDLERTQRLLQQSHQAEARFRVRLQDTVASSAQLQGTVSGQAEFISKQHDELASLQAQVAALQREAERSSSEHARGQVKARDLEQQLGRQKQALEEEARASQSDARLLQLEVQALQAQLAEQQQQRARLRGDGAEAPPGGGPEAAWGGQGDVFLGHSGVSEDREEQMAILTHLVRDLKIKLAEATQAKVEALMRLAAVEPCGEDSTRTHQRLRGDRSRGAVDFSSSSLLKPQASAPLESGSWMEALMNSQWNTKFLGTSLAALTSASPRLLSTSPSSWDSGGAQRKAAAAPAAAAEPPSSKQPASALTSLVSSPRNGKEDEALSPAAETSALPDMTPPADAPNLPASSPAAASAAAQPGPGPDQELAAKQAETLRQAAESARHYAGQLWNAGRIVWSHDDDAASKWNAITSLTQLHEELNREQAAMGLAKQQFPGMPGLGRAEQGSSFEEGAETVPQLEVKQGIMFLAEFGLHALEQFSRQEALSSVGMKFVDTSGPWV